MMLWVRAAIFTLLIPGVVAGLIPYLLSLSMYSQAGFGWVRFPGIPVLAGGVLLYLVSLLSFVVRGGGTPAIWFVRPFRFLIGEEPGRLVGQAVYRHTRNPMFLGVLLSVFGQGLLFDDLSYHLYGVGLLAIFHGVIVFLEEPHLKEKYGDAYLECCKKTLRWIDLPKGQKGAID